MNCHEIKHLMFNGCMWEIHLKCTLCTQHSTQIRYKHTENACYQELSTVLGYVVSTQKLPSAFLATGINTTALPLQFRFPLVAITYH